jgi:hypothetical protein
MVEAVEFFRHVVGGVVHVLGHYLLWDMAAKVDGQLDVVTHARPIAACGRRGLTGAFEEIAESVSVIDEFDHRDLCPACWAATPPELRPRISAA